MKKSEIKSPDTVEAVPGAPDEQLRHCLVTLDGKGEQIKQACLSELLKREYKRGWDDHKTYSGAS